MGFLVFYAAGVHLRTLPAASSRLSLVLAFKDRSLAIGEAPSFMDSAAGDKRTLHFL